MSPNARAAFRAAAVALAASAAVACAARPELRNRPAQPDDSVNIGYGAQPRSRVTGAIASFDASRIEREKALSIADFLERVPGLHVERSANEFTVHVRNASGEPLIVIDGQPLRGATNVLSALRPSDIAHIDVLQDAGATAAYGLQGGNGVIIIRTKLPR